MLSMLKQMLSEDKAESVRQAVTRSLAIIVAFTDDEDKFKQVNHSVHRVPAQYCYKFRIQMFRYKHPAVKSFRYLPDK